MGGYLLEGVVHSLWKEHNTVRRCERKYRQFNDKNVSVQKIIKEFCGMENLARSLFYLIPTVNQLM